MVIVERSNGTYKYGLVSNFEDDDDGESENRSPHAVNSSALMFALPHDSFWLFFFSSVQSHCLLSRVRVHICLHRSGCG